MSTTLLQKRVLSNLSVVFIILSAVILLLCEGLEPSDLECVKSMSSWSPAFEAVHHSWQTFQNDFSQKSIYRGQPTLEMEDAWNDTLQTYPVLVPERRVVLGGDGDDDVLITSSGGQVPAYLEVFRNLACLNLLRQHTYKGEYDYSSLHAFQGSETQIMERVDACVQRLRTVIMCAGDATPYLIMLTPGKVQKESPDFNTLHYCRDFDDILQWTRDNEVHDMDITGRRRSLYA